MKSRLTILAVTALLFGACSSGSYVTRNYTDDIYFNPGDVPPPIVGEYVSAPVPARSAERMVISEIERNENGSNTLNNYIFNRSNENADLTSYYMDNMELSGSDTTYYNDDDVKYVINNYYEGENVDFAYRIRRFHNPYFYDPFYWDSWYYSPFYYSSWHSPYRSMAWNWGWGWNSWYSPYYSWYSPYHSWGWGYPYSSYWYNPYYAWGYPSYNYGGGYNNYENYHYGQRRSTGTNVVYGDNGMRRNVSSISASDKSGNTNGVTNILTESRRNNSVSGVQEVNSVTRNSDATKSAGSEVLTERRRTTAEPSVNTQSNAISQEAETTRTQTYTRPGNETTNRTTTYTRPATNNTQPRVISEGNRSTGSSYTNPGTTSTYNNVYRSSSTYNKSANTNTRTYTTPASRNTNNTYRNSVPAGSSNNNVNRSSGSTGVSRSSGTSIGSGSSGGSVGTGSSGSSGGSRSSGGSSSSGRR